LEKKNSFLKREDEDRKQMKYYSNDQNKTTRKSATKAKSTHGG